MGGAFQDWLDTVSLLDVVSWVVWAGSMIGGLVAIRKWLRPIIKPFRNMLDDWQGEPARPGVAARPGVMERLQRLEDKATEAAFHSQPNHGGSAYDALMRKVDALTKAVEKLGNKE